MATFARYTDPYDLGIALHGRKKVNILASGRVVFRNTRC
jgi:hypothetical protein